MSKMPASRMLFVISGQAFPGAWYFLYSAISWGSFFKSRVKQYRLFIAFTWNKWNLRREKYITLSVTLTDKSSIYLMAKIRRYLNEASYESKYASFVALYFYPKTSPDRRFFGPAPNIEPEIF